MSLDSTGHTEHLTSLVSSGVAMQWQIQEAKAKFSELVQKAVDDGPQTVTRRGKPAVVVVAADEFERMKERTPTLKELLLECPLEGVDLERPRDYGRDIEF